MGESPSGTAGEIKTKLGVTEGNLMDVVMEDYKAFAHHLHQPQPGQKRTRFIELTL